MLMGLEGVVFRVCSMTVLTAQQACRAKDVSGVVAPDWLSLISGVAGLDTEDSSGYLIRVLGMLLIRKMIL